MILIKSTVGRVVRALSSAVPRSSGLIRSAKSVSPPAGSIVHPYVARPFSLQSSVTVSSGQRKYNLRDAGAAAVPKDEPSYLSFAISTRNNGFDRAENVLVELIQAYTKMMSAIKHDGPFVHAKKLDTLIDDFKGFLEREQLHTPQQNQAASVKLATLLTLRAEMQFHTNPSQAKADLDSAIAHDPLCAKAQELNQAYNAECNTTLGFRK